MALATVIINVRDLLELWLLRDGHLRDLAAHARGREDRTELWLCLLRVAGCHGRFGLLILLLQVPHFATGCL